MRAQVDRLRCAGHSACNSLVPEVFELDDDGVSMVVVEHLPDELHNRVRQAAGSCPAAAIILLDDE